MSLQIQLNFSTSNTTTNYILPAALQNFTLLSLPLLNSEKKNQYMLAEIWQTTKEPERLTNVESNTHTL